MSEPVLVVISGPSGSGKTTVIEGLLRDPGCRLAISATTRGPRPDEVDGRSYHFMCRQHFEDLRAEGGFLEWAEVHGQLYGTPRTEIEAGGTETHVILDVDSQGFLAIRSAGVPVTGVFIVPPSMQVLEERLRGRGSETEDQLRLRLENATTEMAASDRYDHLVVNDEVDETIRAIRGILGLEARGSSLRGQAQAKNSR